MTFSDLELARRLEAAEGFACEQFAAARRRLYPKSDAAWMNCAGATVVFDGIDSPITQSFGLGMQGEPTAAVMDEIERFFFERKTAAVHEVSPMAGPAALDVLCARGYRPIEVSNVLYREVEEPVLEHPANVEVRVVGPEEASLWSSVSARGWTHEHPEFEPFVRQMGELCTARENCPCFLAEVDGQPGAAGVLCLHEGVALFGGSATVPELRRRGLQGALLGERMKHAVRHSCDLAMMVAEAGSNSQRNAERKGFRVAYTRLKWRLSVPNATGGD